MKELFCNLFESNQKNEVSAFSAFKLWAVILFSYWVLMGCIFFVSYAISFVGSHMFKYNLASHMAEVNMLYSVIHTANNFINISYLFVVFISLHIANKKHKIFFDSTDAIFISFPSAPHMFVFSVLIWGIIQFVNSLGEIIIIVRLLNNSHYGYRAQGVFPVIFVLKFLFSLLGFVFFRKMLQLGWCGVIVEKK
jgi:hypothetical protein